MGKIRTVLPVEEIVSNTIDTFLKDATETYPSFLNNAPVLVTFYTRAHYKSTYDESFENFNEVVGSESPNKFHKIEKVPIYNLDTSDFGTDITDFGLKGTVTSSCVLLPNTIAPKAEDLIEISIHSSKYLFSVTTTSPDNFGNSKFYKVSFSLSQYTKDEVERQIDKELELDYSLIGTKSNVVHEKSHVEALAIIRQQYDMLLATYAEIFYHKSSQTFINQLTSVVDQNLNYFIYANDLHVPFIAFRNSNNINPSIDRYLSKAKYNQSFLKLIERNDYRKIPTNTLKYAYGNMPAGYYNFNYFLKEKVRFIEYIANPAEHPLEQILEIFNFDVFLESTIIPDDTVDPNIKFLAYFIKLFDSSITHPDPNGTLVTYSKKMDYVNDVLLPLLDSLEARYEVTSNDYSITLSDYYLTPILLFALKSLFTLLANN